MPGIYARYFTVDELHDMAAFYRTSTGQKALQRMPKVLGESYGLLLPRLPGLQHELQEATARIMTKHGLALVDWCSAVNVIRAMRVDGAMRGLLRLVLFVTLWPR
jgi:hypothetical protein